MRRRDLDDIIRNLYKRYKCINREDFYVENAGSHVSIYWHSFMDQYIDKGKVMCVAKFIRKFTNLPIITPIGKLSV